ncbi:hypothetical protein [Paenibacillus sp. CECT 9249]|nr:hypothetical protein [Paenibacillus sp. CECT 9249]
MTTVTRLRMDRNDHAMDHAMTAANQRNWVARSAVRRWILSNVIAISMP